jgi:hypothetical protein
MSQEAVAATVGMSPAAESQAIARLAREASFEINVQGVKYLEQSRAFLHPGTRVYVSHLPRQAWEDQPPRAVPCVRRGTTLYPTSRCG